MPTRKVKSSERRRCINACSNCKRRKERCDGHLPCGRCSTRGVPDDCSFAGSLFMPSSDLSTTVPRNASEDHGLSEGGRLSVSPSPDGPGPEAPSSIAAAKSKQSASHILNSRGTALVPQTSRLIQDGHDKLMFIGDSANLSFLQVIRRLIRDSLGPCDFVEDPLGHLLIEKMPSSESDWILEMVSRPPSRPELADARYLVSWYLRATNCLLNLSDEPELYRILCQWSSETTDDRQKRNSTSATLFLIFAIGAQTCPENRDDHAEKYFNYGRFLTMSAAMEDSDISTIQTNILITMYLLGASRRNAAFMYLGTAVRAAYALGIHRSDINALFDTAEYTLRERLWKALRVLDLFMSASLGRPPSTHETRSTAAEANYSASNDLCAIFEQILTDVYSKRVVSTDVLETISEHHRQWSLRFTAGLATDSIQPGQFIQMDGEKTVPNIGLFHLKEAYYWTIMLLARPFFIEIVSSHLKNLAADPGLESTGATRSPFDFVVASACVDSAIRTVDLLRVLKSHEDVPKRLPFVTNSLFIAALVLGLARFGQLDDEFPLKQSLEDARELLAFFSRHDAVARRNLEIVDNLREACNCYLEKMARRRMERQSLIIRRLFGNVHASTTANCPPTTEKGLQDAPGSIELSGLGFASSTDTEESDGCYLGNTGASDGYRRHDPSAECLMSGMGATTDLGIPMFPRTLLFDPLDQDIPLFPTMDANDFSWEIT